EFQPDSLSRFAPRRVHRSWPWESTGVDEIMAFIIAAIGGLAQLDNVSAVGGRREADERILHTEPRIVGIGDNRAIRVQQSQPRIENLSAEPHPFNLQR